MGVPSFCRIGGKHVIEAKDGKIVAECNFPFGQLSGVPMTETDIEETKELTATITLRADGDIPGI